MNNRIKLEFESVIEGEELNLSDHFFLSGNVMDEHNIHQIIHCLKTYPSIHKLNLSYCNLKDSYVSILLEGLSENPNITSLNLSSNQITHVGAIAIANFLKMNPSLVSLYLHSNEIGKEGLQAIAMALQANTKLRLLDLSKCNRAAALATNLNNVQGLNAYEVGKAFEIALENNCLIYLNLSECFIGSGGVSAIASGLKKNHSLQYLNLEYNYAGNLGAINLIDALSQNKTLVSLIFKNNFITSQTIGLKPNLTESGLKSLKEKLLKTIQENIFIEHLDLDLNLIPRMTDIHDNIQLMLEGNKIMKHAFQCMLILSHHNAPFDVAKIIFNHIYNEGNSPLTINPKNATTIIQKMSIWKNSTSNQLPSDQKTHLPSHKKLENRG